MATTLKIPGTFNFSDFGGIEISGSECIRAQRLIRGGFLSEITDAGLEKLSEYGVRTVIDLRSPSEVSKFPDRLSPYMKYIQIPIFDDDPTSSTMSDSEINRMYANDAQFGYERMLRSYRKMIIDEHAVNAYQLFFRTLQERLDDGAVVFHCSAGKDRTGICSYLLLALLGTEKKENIGFYLSSNTASKERIEWRIQEAIKTHLGSCFVQSVKDLVVVREAYLEQATSLIDQEFGGVNAYLKEIIGVSISEKSDLRQKLVI